MNARAKLIQYINDSGIKKQHIAEQAGINPQKFSLIINGHRKLTVEEFETICKKGLSVDPCIFFN